MKSGHDLEQLFTYHVLGLCGTFAVQHQHGRFSHGNNKHLIANIKETAKNVFGYALGQGYSIISGMGLFTNVKSFRGTVTPIKSSKCDFPWIVLTKNITWEYNSTAYHNERAQFPGRQITAGAQKSPKMSQELSSICTFVPKRLRFEHGGAKLASYSGRHLTSLRPCTYMFTNPVNRPDIYKSWSDIYIYMNVCRQRYLLFCWWE